MKEPKFLLKLYLGTDSYKYDCYCDIPEDKIKMTDSWEGVENSEGNTLLFEFEDEKNRKKMIKELKLAKSNCHYLEGNLIDN